MSNDGFGRTVLIKPSSMLCSEYLLEKNKINNGNTNNANNNYIYTTNIYTYNINTSTNNKNSEEEIIEIIKLQVINIFEALIIELKNLEIDIKDVFFVHLYIENLKFFEIVNKQYCEYFKQFPPSRSCVVVFYIYIFFRFFFYLITSY
jgi:hypothetical protein